MKKTYWIEFIGDRSVKIEEGQSILEASLAAGIPHYHACGGQARCSTCRILVKEGAHHITPINENEKQLRATINMPSEIRLACQAFITGSPVRLHRIIRDDSDMQLYTSESNSSDRLGEEKELALFFLDIRDFTPFIEHYLAFDVIHLLRRLFDIFRRSIKHHDGRIIETAGDGLYAVFGLGDASVGEAAGQAVAAGHLIFQELVHFNEAYVLPHFGHRFEVGIGLHAGKVIIGDVGLGVENNLTVMGLPVNIASRLQAATKELNNSFVVSDRIAALYGGEEKAKKKLKLKGISEKVTVHLFGHAYGNS
ncbi:MAG TPA: adenylate/guanylate cyclase domain-containing protein [Flavisolibacter sp.]|nr:adenylate/guanylate cyclase domain-containing protein [Flavisolibacter sp.]